MSNWWESSPVDGNTSDNAASKNWWDEHPKEDASQDSALTRGITQAKSAAKTAKALSIGDYETVAQLAAERDAYRKANPGTKEGNELMSAWDSGDGIAGGIKNVVGEIGKDWKEAPSTFDALRATGKNLSAMGGGIVEQVPNMVMPMAGMLAGGAAGSTVGGPFGAVVGGWAGATAGNTAAESPEQVDRALQSAGIDPQDTAAAKSYLDANGGKIAGQALTKGAIIGAVDTATMGIGGKVLTAPARAAADRALREMGVNLSDKAAVKAAQRTTEFANKIGSDAVYQASQKGAQAFARNTAVGALEPAGEFAGEYFGQGAATGDWDTKGATLEALSSLGQSGITFAGQKAYQYATNPFSKATANTDTPKADVPRVNDYTLVTDPAPIQQRIDAMLRIDRSAINEKERIAYEKAWSDALNEPVGITHDENGIEKPLTMGAYLDAQDQARQIAELRARQNQDPNTATVPNQDGTETVIDRRDGPLSAAAVSSVKNGVLRERDFVPPPTGRFGQMDELANLIDSERQDVEGQRNALVQGQQLRRASELESTDARVEAARIQQTNQHRDALLQNVLENLPEGQNPNRAFDRALRSMGFTDTNFRPEEVRTIQNWNNVIQSAQPETIPSAPNELDAEAMGIRSLDEKQKVIEANRRKFEETRKRIQAQRGGQNGTNAIAPTIPEVATSSLESSSGQLSGSGSVLASTPAGDTGSIVRGSEMAASGVRPAVPAGTTSATGLTQPQGIDNVTSAPSAQTIQAETQGQEQQPAAAITPEVKAYPLGQAKMRANRMTNFHGFPTEIYPHPTQPGMYALRPIGENNARRSEPTNVQQPAEAQQATEQVAPIAAVQGAQEVAQLPARRPVKPKTAPIMRRDDLVGAIMRATGGRGIHSNMATTLVGDTANNATRVRGLFTNQGQQDMDDLAMLLREQEGFDVRDASHLEDLVREAAAGNVAKSMERQEREKADAQEKQYRDTIRQKAKKFGIKTVAVKFSDVEKSVLARMEERHNQAVSELDERSQQRFNAALEDAMSAVPEAVVDETMAEVTRRGLSARDFWNETTRILRGMIYDAKQEAANGTETAAEEVGDGRGNRTTGSGDAANQRDQAPAGQADERSAEPAEEQRPGLALEGQTPAEVRAQEAQRQAEEARTNRPEPDTSPRVKADQVDLFNTQSALFNNNRETPAEPKKQKSIPELQAELKKADPFSRISGDLNGKLIERVTEDAQQAIDSGIAPTYGTGQGTFVVIHPSAQNEGMIQVTRYSERGVFGDSQYNTLEQAVRDNVLWTKARMSQGEADAALKQSLEAEAEYQRKRQEAEQQRVDTASAPVASTERAHPQQTARGEVGASLSKEQRKEVLKTLVDVYKANNAPKEFKGVDRNGNERSGYAHSPEFFVKSDITGAMVRYYVTLPDGRIAHPTELFSDYTQSDIDAALQKQISDEKNKKDFDAMRLESLNRRSAPSLNEANRLFWKANPGLSERVGDDFIPAILTDGSSFIRTRPDMVDDDLRLLGDGWTRQLTLPERIAANKQKKQAENAERAKKFADLVAKRRAERSAVFVDKFSGNPISLSKEQISAIQKFSTAAESSGGELVTFNLSGTTYLAAKPKGGTSWRVGALSSNGAVSKQSDANDALMGFQYDDQREPFVTTQEYDSTAREIAARKEEAKRIAEKESAPRWYEYQGTNSAMPRSLIKMNGEWYRIGDENRLVVFGNRKADKAARMGIDLDGGRDFKPGNTVNVVDFVLQYTPTPGSPKTPEKLDTSAERVKETAENKPVSQERGGQKLEDFGERLDGAKKHTWASSLTAVSDGDIAASKLSDAWPHADYQELIDNGADPMAVGLVRSLRDSIPSKPRLANKARRWAATVAEARKVANALIEGKIKVDELRAMKDVYGRAELYAAVGHEKSLEGMTFAWRHYSLYKGQENVSFWSVEQQVAATAFSNFPREVAKGDTKEAALNAFREEYKKLGSEAQKKKSSYVIFVEHGKNGYFIGKKIGRNTVTLSDAFKTVAEARAYRDNHSDALDKALEKYKEVPRERRDTNNPRVGEDMRDGMDATPEMFAEAFGFRGVQFGNWVEQKKRQSDLNDAYDALMDMAAVLGIPAKAISLNGELGLAFGARGSGGTNAAAAHYEPDMVVINLTKKNGAGSLGHEWWHALDGYFARMRNKGSQMTDALDVSLAARGSNFSPYPGVRREMVEAFGAVMASIAKTGMADRSRNLDRKRTKDYWGEKAEMSARAFEAYLISKLQDQNASNDYLSNIVDSKTWEAAAALGLENENSYPYPTDPEIPSIRAGFDRFFQTIETKETENGVALFSKGAEQVTTPMPQPAAETRIKSLLGDKLGRVLIESGIVSFSNQGNQYDGATFSNGNIVLNLDALNDEKIAGVLAHEGFHSTVKELIGEETYSQLMEQLEKLTAANTPWANEAKAAVPKDTKAGEVTEEIAAYAVQQHVSGAKLSPFLKRWASSFLSALRTAIIRRLPFGKLKAWAVKNVQPEDLARLAMAGLKAKAQGRLQQGREAMAYSRERKTPQTETEAFKRWFGDSKVVESGLEELLSKPDGVGVLLRDLLAAQNATGSGLNPVQALMLALAKNDKIGRGIVGLVPVDVVNSFSKDGLRPKDGGGNTSMFVNALNAPVSDQVLSTFRGILTSLSTKLANAIATGRDQEIAPALLASDFNLREVGGLLSLQGSTDFWGGNTGVKSVSAGEAAKSTSPGLSSPAKDFKLDATALADLFNKFVSFAPHAKTSTSDDLPSAKYIAKQGKPLVVYHGTMDDVEAFDENKGYKADPGWLGRGFYFTTNPDTARYYATNAKVGKADPNIMPVFLSLKNPYYATTKDKEHGALQSFGNKSEYAINRRKELIEQGYDGVILDFSKGGWAQEKEIVVFHPEQIKSATGNNGDFDPSNPDIRYSKSAVIGDSGRNYNADQRTFFKNVGREIDRQNVIDRTLNYLKSDFWKKMAVGLVDQFRGLRDLNDGGQAYMLARLSKGTAGAFDTLLHHGKLSLKDGVYDGDTSGGFVERLGVPLNGELDDFLWWVAANRAEGLTAQGKENLFSPTDIQAGKSLAAGLTTFDYTIQTGQSKGTTTRNRQVIYQDALRVFNEFQKNVLDLSEESGLIDGASRQHWESEFYVPFYRVSEEDGEFVGAKMGNALVRQQAFKKLKGGTDKLNSDLLTNTLMNLSHLIEASAKNRAARAALSAAENMGAAQRVAPDMASYAASNGTMLPPGTKKTVWFQQNGKKVEYLVSDPFVMTAITSLEYAGMRNGVMDAMTKFKHLLTVGVTASPAFKVRNLIRDSIQAIGTSDLGYNPIKNVVDGFKQTNRESQAYVSALASGGLIRFGTMLEGSESSRVRQLIKAGVKDSSILNNEAKWRQFYDKYVDPAVSAYNELGNRSEEINRAALYNQLIKQGKSHGEAALLARDLMDFGMMGSFNTIRFLGQVVPFFNARLQGMYKLGRSAKDNPKKLAVVTGAVAVASIALMLGYDDDEDWKRREDWDRDGFWFFKFGGVEYRIPKPFEVGAVASLAERSVEYLINDEMTGERFRKVVGALAMNNLSMNPVPQMVKPMIDLYANKDSFTGRPIESMSMERLEKTMRFNSNTSMPARALSNATLGALSPVQYDHLARAYFGWLGAFAVGGADMAYRAVSDEPTQPARDYFKFFSQGIMKEEGTGSSRYLSNLYDQASELETVYSTYRQLLKDGKHEDAIEYAADNTDELRRYKSVEAIKKVQTRMNQNIRVIERDPDMAADEKKIRIDRIQKMKEQFAKRISPGA